LKIGVDIYQTGFPFGGISRYVRSLLSAMVVAAPDDAFFLFSNHFRGGHRPRKFSGSNVTHFNLKAPRRLVQSCWDRLEWPPVEAFLGPLDIFHGTHFVLPAVRSAKRVLTLHDIIFLKHPEYYSDRILNEWGHRVELPSALKRADIIVTVSEYTRTDLIEWMQIPAEKIRVVYEGVESHFFLAEDPSKSQAVLGRLGLIQPYMVFLVGTPEPRKNLLRTVAAARKAAPDIPLVVIGPQEPIRRLLNGDDSGIHLIGSVPEEELPFVLHGAVLALYPSLAEGFGLPALEALAAGVPLVTSNCSALPEVVGNAALLVDPTSIEAIAEAIGGLLENEGRRQALIQAGKARAREFSWERAASQTLAVYREIA
jgi:glycosyltransferase involved in cell wall biosynthesis